MKRRRFNKKPATAHGGIGTGDNSHMRRCDTHGWHGSLYACEAYSDDTLRGIAESAERYRTQQADPEWRARQIANGVPEIVLDIFRELSDT